MKNIARKCSKIMNCIARKFSNRYKIAEEAENDLENVYKVNRICSKFIEHVCLIAIVISKNVEMTKCNGVATHRFFQKNHHFFIIKFTKV